MVADGMLTRQRYREVPPRVDYELTERARELAPVLGELARWGYEWAWGPPRPSERVDLGAIFRLIPGLISSQSSARGTVELTVSDGNGGEPMSYRVTLSPGSATISERGEGSADAEIRGSSEAWIQALSPQGVRNGLQSTGDRTLADGLLSILALSDTSRAVEQGSVAAPA
jgi:hypothetical protein